MFGFDRFKTIKKQAQIVFKSRFLDNLTPLERYEFLQLCHRRSYNEGEFIYYQGDPGTGMYFLEEGKVELVVEPEARSKEDTNTYIIEAPESFGALSIGYELRRMSSAKCLTDSILLGFFKPDFETLRDRHPKIAVKFLETLSMIAMKQLEKTTNALIEAKGIAEAFSIQFATYYDAENEKV
ncbi:cyclic nucleotide-binding domain-containing protein [Aliifodinibius sp. S!AR15-10]|uniref:cyclic nucleotide-binding domain-containing protein n=1 Tax=Aliifodinibius sp. S!AR15-10 TaxID=2950437 RepID=UPI002866F621|nr:cyclic nucleotide-binding domain-containing protein [Aliifodinibius sp. S!AR15-10]MDR8392584.1 cyclic nucleotide-binding domain-containing protein [Aliifodinibius sp. S!AR15-10]